MYFFQLDLVFFIKRDFSWHNAGEGISIKRSTFSIRAFYI